jgi:CheY-like chemotaxis protein
MPLHILLVEDDAKERHAFAEVLEQAGYVVHPFEDSRGVTEFIELGSQIDLLVVDIILTQGMPHGVSVARMVGWRRPKLPVLYLTGHQHHADFVRRSDKVLLKPITSDALLQAVLASLSVGDGGKPPSQLTT